MLTGQPVQLAKHVWFYSLHGACFCVAPAGVCTRLRKQGSFPGCVGAAPQNGGQANTVIWWVALLCVVGALVAAAGASWLLLWATGYQLHMRRDKRRRDPEAGSDSAKARTASFLLVQFCAARVVRCVPCAVPALS